MKVGLPLGKILATPLLVQLSVEVYNRLQQACTVETFCALHSASGVPMNMMYDVTCVTH